MTIKTDKEIVTLMKILSNINRLKILRTVYSAKIDLCVNEIADMTAISQSLASHQLAYLSAHNLVKGIRKGQTICYVPEKNKSSTMTQKILNVLLNK